MRKPRPKHSEYVRIFKTGSVGGSTWRADYCCPMRPDGEPQYLCTISGGYTLAECEACARRQKPKAEVRIIQPACDEYDDTEPQRTEGDHHRRNKA